ncbi:uncharacterized protein [Magallana gigas]|uniref:uncharacterized protein n=1 Tax=Magallana gigas TaxID=29159 RepID=UPI00333FCBF9
MALHRPTFQLNTVSERHPSSRLVDGKQSELHINNNQCSSTCNYQCYAMWRVDLQNTRRIERIVVYSRTDNVEWGENNEFARKLLGFSIIVSNTTDLRDGVVCYDNTDYNISTTPSVVDIFCSVVGRYVIYYNERLPGVTYPELYSQYAFADLCEVEVYGCPVPGYGHEDSACTIPCSQMCKNYLEHLSYMKQTWLSSPFDGSSDKAVDGRFTSRSISDQQCTISQPNATITWWVNLGKVYMIDHIVMYFRTENLEWGINNGYTAAFLGFSLYISNTTEKEDGILCHHDTTYTRQTIPDHVSIECPYHGQYVIFYNERLPGVTYPSGYSSKVYGDLCEVEVYGCPSPVADISQCSNPCPDNCEECFPGTGYCIRCKRGFEGIACEMVCQAMIKKYSIERHNNYTGSLEDLHTSKGVTFFGDYRVSIDMFLTEESKNVASISFTVHKTSDVMVTTVEGRDFRGLAFNRVTKEKEHWDMTVPTSIFSTAYLVSIGPLARPSFTLSNLRLPLRKCYKNTR